MKILYDYQIFFDQEYGGPSRYYIELAKYIKKYESLKICAPLYINKYLSEFSQQEVYGLKLNTYFSSFIPFRIKLKFNKFFLNPINKIIFRRVINNYAPDIIHHTNYENLKINYQKLNKKKIANILTVYDLIHEKFYDQYNRNKNFRPKQEALNNADKIICISKNTKSDLINIYNINKEKIEVIYLASQLKKAKNLDKKINLKKNFLLFVGKRQGYKNFLNFAKAYSISKNLKNDFNIICFGDNEFSKIEINEFKKMKISNSIFHLKGDDNLLVELYSNATALIYPSLYEGFGLPILEAMSLECPVICSNTSSLPEIGGNAARYFDPNNIESMSTIINQTIYDKLIIKKMIENGLNRTKLFSWENCGRETLDVYKKLL